MSTGAKRMSENTNEVSTETEELPSEQTSSLNDSKKAKLNHAPSPSRVVHLRNVPGDTTEAEILYLGLLFGCPTNVLIMRGAKRFQAFLEMPDEASATKLINYYSQYPAVIRGREIFMQFSTYQKLNIDEKQAANAAALVQAMASNAAAAAATVPGVFPIAPMNLGMPFLGNGMPVATGPGLNPAALVASQLLPPPQPNFAGGESAGGEGEDEETAKQEPKNEEKEMEEEAEKKSDSKESDDAEDSQPVENETFSGVATGEGPVLCIIVENMMFPVSIDLLYWLFADFGEVLRIVSFYKNYQYHALLEYRDASMASAAKAALNGHSIFNGWCQLKISHSKLEKVEVRHDSDKAKDFTKEAPSFEYSLNALHLAALHQGGSLPFSSLLPTGGPYGAGGSGAAAAMAPTPVPVSPASHLLTVGAAMPSVGIQQPGSVVIVSNLNEHAITPQALFTLFGVYGIVLRVKIMFSKRDTALIQFADPSQARLALQHLNGVTLYDKEMYINISRHAVVQLPREGVDRDSHLTQDYSHSKLHRYSRTGVDVRKIYPPSQTLHLSNIPLSESDEALKEVFLTAGFAVEKFQRFKGKENDENYRKNTKMALVQLSSTEEAIKALIKIHNHQLSDGYCMRVSFAKNSTIHPG